jgi:hypothetical protein
MLYDAEGRFLLTYYTYEGENLQETSKLYRNSRFPVGGLLS